MAFDINNALNTLTGTVGREMVDDLVGQAMVDNPETVAALFGGALRKRNPHLLNFLAIGATELLAGGARKAGMHSLANVVSGAGHGVGSGLQRLAQQMQQDPNFTPTEADIQKAQRELSSQISGLRQVAQSASFVTRASPRVLAAVSGLLAAAHEEMSFDNPAAYAYSPPSGGHNQYRGVCGQAHQLAHVIPWAMKNAPADLSAIMETTAAVADTQALRTTGAVYESVRQWPGWYVGQAIPLLLELNTKWWAKFQDWRDLMLNTNAAGDRARGWWGWIKANKEVLIGLGVVAAIGAAVLTAMAAFLVLIVLLAAFGGMLVGGSLITYALSPVIFLEPLKYPLFFAGVIFWAASVALSMPVITDALMILSGKSEEPEPPGFLARLLAMGLQRLGFNTQFMLAMPQAATRIRGFRKMAKRVNVIVMAVSVLAILVDVVATPVTITWMTVRALFILGIFIWLFVDYVGFNERSLNEGQKFTDKMAQSSIKFILTPAILGLAVVILFVGMPLSIAEQVAHWAWDESADVREDAVETAAGWFDDDSSSNKANPDDESDAAKTIEELRRKHKK